MNKKSFIIAILIIIIALCGVTLVGCDRIVDKGEEPVKWDSYVSEIAESYYQTFRLASGIYTMSFDFKLKHIVGGNLTTYDGTFKITQDTNNPNLSAFEFDVYQGSEHQERRRVFYFACNNYNTYIFAKNFNGSNDVKYQFENTPVFSLYRIDIADPAVIKATVYDNIKKITKTVDVNADKSIYTFDFDLKNYIVSLESEIDKLFDIIPAPVIDEINNLFNTNVNKWTDVLKDTVGKADIALDNNQRITGLRIYDMQSFVSEESKIEEIEISNIKVIALFYNIDRELWKNIEKDKGDYPKTKIGTISIEGNMELVDSSAKRSAITYDYKFNSSIDLLALAANGFDFAALDDNNYLHLRISHTCNSNCTNFCSVNYGNKLESGKGAVIDIAFSPKDFGTKYLYVSLGVGQLISKKTITEIAGSAAGLANLALPQYVLLTLDTSAYAFENEQNNGILLLQFLLGLNSNLSIYSDYLEVDIDKILKLANIERNGLINSLLNLGGYNIDTLKVNYGQPQFGVVTDNDIYRESIHLIDYNYPDTKNYNNALYSPNPSIDWDFYDYTEIAQNNVLHTSQNIYWSDSQVMYSDSVPISPQEIVNLKGCYINYKFTDIYHNTQNDRGEEYKGKARIIDVVGVNKKLIGKYQKVYLKVQLPSKWLGIADKEPIASIAGQTLYAFCETYIKLTDMAVNGMIIERTDIENGALVTKYELKSKASKMPMLNGMATIKYTNGHEKKVNLVGSCDAVRVITSMISSVYSIAKVGDNSVKFTYAGKSSDFAIKILSPITSEFILSEGRSTVFKKNQEYSYISFGMYYVNLAYQDADKTPYKYELDFTNYYIYGKPLSQSSAYWDTYIDSGGSTIIKFKVDGQYKLEARFIDKVQMADITVTSNVTDKSTYQILSNNSGMTAGANARLHRSYYVKNRYHGVSGLDNLSLSMEVHKGTVSSSGVILYYNKLQEGEDTYTIYNIKYNSLPYDSNMLISLPRTIYKAIPIAHDIIFKQVGYYRITIKLASNIYMYEYIEVI